LGFYLSISACYDISYASFGGPIVSQLFYVMFNISSSGFSKNRDKFIYPFCDFFFIIVELGIYWSIFSPHISWTSLERFALWNKCNCLKCIFFSLFYYFSFSVSFSLPWYYWCCKGISGKTKIKIIRITKNIG
jgi:hypothetical protein